GRDNDRLDRVENIGITLWNGTHPYELIISASGDVLDMKGGDIGWNCDVLVMTNMESGGWTAEVLIPLDEMALDMPKKAVWRINVSRKDGITGEEGRWIPLFSGASPDPSQFAELKF
ncbi:MAG: hypothetical protein ABIH23_15710, partial [bacterium]